MLKKMGEVSDKNPTRVKICDAKFPEPFNSGLEYSPPARGTWNIAHTGMLMPQSHQIFACAQGCIRGVILTAAEMNAMDRMSFIATTNEDLFEGTLEKSLIEGTSQILDDMDNLPRAVLIFISCAHLFAGCDFEYVLDELREKYPAIDFVDCYMTPTMRKSIPPDVKMRMQLYAPLGMQEKNPKSVNLIGLDRATDSDSELVKIIRSNGFTLRDITLCENYDEFLKMGESFLNVTYTPTAVIAGQRLESRLKQKHLYIPLCYGYEEIVENYQKLCAELNVEIPDFSSEISKAEDALKKLSRQIGDTAVAVDYTATPRFLGLARLLIEHNINVKYIFADTLNEEEKADFQWLQENSPELEIICTLDPQMRFEVTNNDYEKVLAVGQKSAYFCQTDNFVNIVAGGGLYGFEGISKLCGLMDDAFENPKDRRTVIQRKAVGCESCV